jgi:hypothetical protein
VTARRTFAQVCAVIESVLADVQANQMSFQNLSVCFLDSITQNGKGINVPFSFKFFYQNALILANEERTDFELTRKLTRDVGVALDTTPIWSMPNAERARQVIRDLERS